jgi:diguanylate cyclase (GGDEF)-like protein
LSSHNKKPWLCPTELDRARLVDASGRVRTLRFVSLGALAVALAAATPWQSPFYLLLAAVAGALFVAVDLTIKRVRRPEWVSAGAILATIALLAVGVAVSGGPHSPELAWLVLPLGVAAARFRPQVVLVALLITLAALAGATVGAHTAATVNSPTPVIATAGLAVSLLSIVWAIQAAELEQREAAVLDPLTSLLNRNSLRVRFAELAHQARLSGRPISLLLCDVDSFKQINDTYGHDRGDAVLVEVAALLRNQLRSFELIYRFGGEEFLVLLPGVGSRRAYEVAERLRKAIEAARPGGLPVTASFGAACASGRNVSFETLFKKADQALYEAKGVGGNAVFLALPEGSFATFAKVAGR